MASRILIFDNYDSFTYNLVHLVEKIIHGKVDVRKNDECPTEELRGYDKIILSPGPGLPDEAGNLKKLIKQEAGRTPILGVCLGLQAIAEVFGGRLENLEQVHHGIALPVLYNERENLFRGMKNPFAAGRYHSWIVSRRDLPDCLEIIAWSENDGIMGLKHKEMSIQGVQFHPESILTPEGEILMRNWLNEG